MSNTSKTCFIDIDNVVLSYPVGRFVKGSLKSAMLGLFGHRETKITRSQVTALNGMSLKIHSGEKVGIIGRNGAGKSTLLRAIAGIYPLVSGKITVSGKIQSLFELGTGFEPDSSGRENIRYRGLAMGCEPGDIEAREEDIIHFADIGEFIDLPIRTYSAGMFVRLAFGISTYLEGNILLIDEVFGAGDASFRARAIQRMEEIVERSHIMLFVSHDMETIERICNRVIWIDDGHVKADGPPEKIIEHYLEQVGQPQPPERKIKFAGQPR